MAYYQVGFRSDLNPTQTRPTLSLNYVYFIMTVI